jgi:hypothetical protein
MFNLDGKIGGDADLSPRGELYAKKLPALVRESVGVSIPITFLSFPGYHRQTQLQISTDILRMTVL